MDSFPSFWEKLLPQKCIFLPAVDACLPWRQTKCIGAMEVFSMHQKNFKFLMTRNHKKSVAFAYDKLGCADAYAPRLHVC